MIIGLAISYMTNGNDPPADRILISPVAHFLLPKENVKQAPILYYNVDTALKIIEANCDTEK